MSVQPPPPPSITPRQMNLLRAVTSMAWADGVLEAEEVNIMLDSFSLIFARDAARQRQLQEELRDYLMQKVPLEEVVPQLESREEKELALKLGYEVIACSSRTPEEPKINPEEAAAYQKLVQLLDLPSEVVADIEAEVRTALEKTPIDRENIGDAIAHQIEEFTNS